MATTSVRKLTDDEVKLVCSALELAAKSAERASKGSSNPVISAEYTKLAAMCRNLITFYRNGALDI